MFLTFFGNIWTWLISKISLKGIAIFLLLCLLAWGGYSLYRTIYDQGVASTAAATKVLTEKLTNANAAAAQAQLDLKNYQTQFANWQKSEAAKDAEKQKEQDQINADLTKQLAGYADQVAQLSKVKNDLSKYISKANDSGCVVPSGFMFLYNKSLQGSEGQYLLSVPTGAVAYAPSGLSLTDVASVFLDNNLAAQRNRELVLAWQKWYNDNAAVFKKLHATAPPSPVVKPADTSEKPSSSLVLPKVK